MRVLDRRIRRHDDDLGFLGEARDRRHLVERHRRLVHQERADHDEAVDHELVAVALRAVDELREADGAAGARDVGHLHALRDLGGDKRLLHRARGLVPAAAGRGGRHDLEFKLLREGRAAGCKGQCDGRAEQAPIHLLNKGVMANGDITLGVAGIDLIYLRLSALLCAADHSWRLPCGHPASGGAPAPARKRSVEKNQGQVFQSAQAPGAFEGGRRGAGDRRRTTGAPR